MRRSLSVRVVLLNRSATVAAAGTVLEFVARRSSPIRGTPSAREQPSASVCPDPVDSSRVGWPCLGSASRGALREFETANQP